MTTTAAGYLLVLMVGLAVLPSASVALVVTRSATHGFPHGAAVASGIVIGDLIFVTLAVLGLSALTETGGGLVLTVFRYLGGSYLIWLGLGLLRSRRALRLSPPEPSPASLLASFAAGLALTLGDLKALLFYASLFPSIVDLDRLTAGDVGLIALITTVAVGGVKLTYAHGARKMITHLRPEGIHPRIKTAVGVTLMATGVLVIIRM